MALRDETDPKPSRKHQPSAWGYIPASEFRGIGKIDEEVIIVRRARVPLVAMVSMGLLFGGITSAAATPKTETTYFVAGCATVDVTYWQETGQTAHGAGTIYATDYYLSADGVWSPFGIEVNPFEGFLNFNNGVNTHRGEFHLTSAVIGGFDGTFIWTQEQWGTPRGNGVGKSTDGKVKLRVTIGVDPASFPPSPCGGYVSEFVVTPG